MRPDGKNVARQATRERGLCGRMVVGKGCWMDYDGISEKEAMELMKEIQARYDRMRMERSGRNGKRKG